MKADISSSLVTKLLSPGGRRARLIIFCFHRVLEGLDVLRPGEPDSAEFAHDIEKIASNFNVLTVSEAARCMAEGDLPASAACITFDDGYADNHELAAPILESVGAPATFFIAGNAVDEGVMWNDLVIEAVARCGADAALQSLPVATDRDALHTNPASSTADLLQQLKYLPLLERQQYAEQFYTSSTGENLPRLMMRRQQIADLCERGFEIGGHTISHPILQKTQAEQANEEILGCRQWVYEVTERLPTSFAYPNGLPGRDFSVMHETMVADAGFECAVSTHWSAAKRDTNRFCIPRVGPWWRQGYGFASGLARSYTTSYIR